MPPHHAYFPSKSAAGGTYVWEKSVEIFFVKTKKLCVVLIWPVAVIYFFDEKKTKSDFVYLKKTERQKKKNCLVSVMLFTTITYT